MAGIAHNAAPTPIHPQIADDLADTILAHLPGTELGGGGHLDCLRHARSDLDGFPRPHATRSVSLAYILASARRSLEVPLPLYTLFLGRSRALPRLRL